ncbi:MAG: poly(3-hydroxybutyrate) depolymerase [Cognaticolwellia sp.]|jgi:poly(3-hydroxybutyrate) depolymerase
MIHLLLLACVAEPEILDSQGGGDDSGEETGLPPLPLDYSGGVCPDFSGDEVTFESLGAERTVLMLWPEEPQGAPLVYAWHWLDYSTAAHDKAEQAITYFELSKLTDQGYIVVVPTSHEDQLLEWGYFQDADDSLDLALFDDTLSCLNEQYGIDRKRVYSTGFSAGALFTTRLGMKRSQYLAAIAPMSGGTEPFQPYLTPEQDIAVMATWGGPQDLFSGLSFEEATLELAEKASADGSFVALCEHQGGHDLPSVRIDHVRDFFAAHTYGEPSPWADGLPSDLWSGCFLPEAGE